MNTACPVEMAKSLRALISEKRREGELRARLSPEVVEAVLRLIGRRGRSVRSIDIVEKSGLGVTTASMFRWAGYRDLARRYLLDGAEHQFGVVLIHRPHQSSVPGPPLNGPVTAEVIQPP